MNKPEEHRPEQHQSARRHPHPLSWVIGVAMLAFIVWVLAALFKQDNSDTELASNSSNKSGNADAAGGAAAFVTSGESSGGSHSPVELSEILQKPAEFKGKSVSVQGQVDKVINKSAFTLRGGPQSKETIIVLSTNSTALQPGELLEVHGRVHAANLDGMSEAVEINWHDAPITNWAGKPYIRSEGISRAQRSE